MSVALLPLCSQVKRATKDGYGGANARLFLPFYGYWFASGQVPTFAGSTAYQDNSLVDAGSVKPDTFQKDGVVCSS